MAYKLLSDAFADGSWVPDIYTCQGANISPSLEWSGEPPETRSFALLLEDPDAPSGTWTHWVLFDLPAKTHNLAQGHKPNGLGLSGLNDFGKQGYGGPCPPKGHGPHRYFFKLIALDVPTLGVPAGAHKDEVKAAIKGHVLAETQYMGRFERH